MSVDQTPFADVGIAMNPEPRCPCMLVLDTSGSMGGQPIQELNAGLQTLRDELVTDSLAMKRVEISIITFGGAVQTVVDFATAEQFVPPVLTAGGDTPMGAAIEAAVAAIESRKQTYRTNGVMYYRPWLFLITDGAPTDTWKGAAEQAQKAEVDKKLVIFGVGVEGANFEVLRQFTGKFEPLKLKGLQFRSLFQWLSASQKSVSRSKVGDDVAPPPVTWGTIPT